MVFTIAAVSCNEFRTKINNSSKHSIWISCSIIEDLKVYFLYFVALYIRNSIRSLIFCSNYKLHRVKFGIIISLIYVLAIVYSFTIFCQNFPTRANISFFFFLHLHASFIFIFQLLRYVKIYTFLTLGQKYSTEKFLEIIIIKRNQNKLTVCIMQLENVTWVFEKLFHRGNRWAAMGHARRACSGPDGPCCNSAWIRLSVAIGP